MVDIAEMIVDVLERFIKNISLTSSLRSEESRRLLPVLDEDGLLISLDEKDLWFPGKDDIRSVEDGIIGVDSSSRVVDTPYFFIGIGAVSALDRIFNRSIDCPDITLLYSTIYTPDNISDTDCKWLSLVPEVSIDKNLLDFIMDRGFINIRSPAGIEYDHRYNKYAVLNELRLMLENRILYKLSEMGGWSRILLIDGPLYHTPSLFNLYIEKSRPPELKPYIDSWRILLGERIKLLRRLIDKGYRVLGVVKRLEYSRLLSRSTISSGRYNDLNDHAYLTITAYNVIKKYGGVKPFILGPFKLSPSRSGIDVFISGVFDKIVYYVAIPRIKTMPTPNNYIFYRVESASHDMGDIGVVLADSIGSGSAIPLSILLVDKRVKGLSRSLYYFITRVLENTSIPLTYDSMRSIEGYYSG